MAAPAGNQFWKLRSKHGRDKIFEDEELLWSESCDFFNWCDAHPWYKVEQLKKPYEEIDSVTGKKRWVTIVKVPTARPYTLAGLCVYLNTSESYWRSLRKNKNLSEGYLSVISRIEAIIDAQQFEGAAVGAFNANIISRKLGLAEKTDNRNENFNYNTKELTSEEIKAIGKALEDEC